MCNGIRDRLAASLLPAQACTGCSAPALHSSCLASHPSCHAVHDLMRQLAHHPRARALCSPTAASTGAPFLPQHIAEVLRTSRGTTADTVPTEFVRPAHNAGYVRYCARYT